MSFTRQISRLYLASIDSHRSLYTAAFSFRVRRCEAGAEQRSALRKYKRRYPAFGISVYISERIVSKDCRAE